MRRFAIIVGVLACAVARADVDAWDVTSDASKEALERLEAWDIAGADEVVRHLEKVNPGNEGTKYLRGRIHFENGEYDKAVELFRDAMGPGAEHNQDTKLAIAVAAEVKGMAVQESAHFIVHYRPGKDAALVPFAIDGLEAAYTALTTDLGWAPTWKVRVEFYASPKALARVSSLSEEAIRTTGTIALCKYNRLMVTSPRALQRGYEWQDTLAHEFTHYLVTHKSRNTVPIWIHEGIAKYLETRWRGPAGKAIEAGSEALLARAVRLDKFISFERMNPSIALLPSQEDAALAFAEVFTAMEYVDRRKGMAGIRAIIDGLREGKKDRDSVAAAVGTTFAAFESEWKKSLKERPAPKGSSEFEKMIFRDEKKDAKKERLKSYERGELGTIVNADAKKAAHLGELLRARNRLEAAVIEFEKALKLAGSPHSALARKYALTKLALGDPAPAEKALREALEVDVEDATNHLLLGKILVGTKRAAEAKVHFLTAVRRDPFDPEIHEGLAAVAKATGDEALGIRAREVLAILKGEKTVWGAAKAGTPSAYGFLRIEEPTGAKVFVDDVATGLTTPIAEQQLPVGRHIVRLELPDGKVFTHAVTVIADEIALLDQS